MSNNILLISIKPEYASKIFSGQKTVELRRVKTRLQPNDLVIVYVTSPLKVLMGSFKVKKVTTEENLEIKIDNFWHLIKNDACIDREGFIDYYKGATIGVAIFIIEAHKFTKSVPLQLLKDRVKNFHPPQSYHYLDNKDIEILEYLTKEKIDKIKTDTQVYKQLKLTSR